MNGVRSDMEILDKISFKVDENKIQSFCKEMSLCYFTKHSLHNNIFTLKKDVKMYDSEYESMLIASNVETPPLRTAGPMPVIASRILTDRVPVRDRKARHM
jgi:hypothetical protein